MWHKTTQNKKFFFGIGKLRLIIVCQWQIQKLRIYEIYQKLILSVTFDIVTFSNFARNKKEISKNSCINPMPISL